jgi:tRNA modification GTPase
VRRARDRARTSDLVLWLVDAKDEVVPLPQNGDDHAPVWIVRNKVDLVGGENAGAVTAQFDISAAHEEAFLT